MKFEYDDNKSYINKSKHGIDFQEAQELWEDPYSFENIILIFLTLSTLFLKFK